MLSETQLKNLENYFISVLGGIFLSDVRSITVSEIHVVQPARIRVQFTIELIKAIEMHDLLQRWKFRIEPRIGQFDKENFIIDFIVDGCDIN